MATTNLNLDEVALSNTFGQLVEMFNGNMDKLDALPIPIEYGKNTTMEYLKLSSGKILMWGTISYGTSKPCNIPWDTGYSSVTIDIDFPVALKKNNPTLIPHVQCSKWIACECYSRNITYTGAELWFVSDINDDSKSNSKTLHLLIIGDWK